MKRLQSILFASALAGASTSLIAQTPTAPATPAAPSGVTMPASPSPQGPSAAMPADHHHHHAAHHAEDGHHAGYHAHHHGERQIADPLASGAFLRRLDTDRDGHLSRAELLAAHAQQLERFDKADSDRDGKLSPIELRALRRSLQPARHPGHEGAPGAAAPRGSGS